MLNYVLSDQMSLLL